MATETILETLVAARDLISNPSKWTKKAYFRKSSGESTYDLDPQADQFCGIGALSQITQMLPFRVEQSDLGDALRDATGTTAFSSFNDSHTHAEVLAAFDAAIEKARIA